MRKWIIVLGISLLLSSIPALPEFSDANSVLLTRIRIFDVSTGEICEAQDILIIEGRIKKMGKIDPRPVDIKKIDCAGRYAVPGLCDSHTHLAYLTTMGAHQPKKGLEDFVRHGITFVRDVGGPHEVLKNIKDQVLNGEIAGPEIFFTGPMLEKSPMYWTPENKILPGFTVGMNTKEDVDRMIPQLVKSGACMVKTFNKMDLDIYKYLVASSDKNRLKVVHDPGSPLFHMIPMDTAMDLGVKSIEHGKAPWPIVLKDELQKEHDKLLQENAEQKEKDAFTAKVLKQGIESVSAEKLVLLINKMVEGNVFFCPTLQVFEQMMKQPPEKGVTKEDHAARIANVKSMIKVGNYFTEEIFRKGVKILVGQDGVLPAETFAEMKILKKRGMPEAEIIKGATLYPAEWLGVSNRLGSIAQGKQADIVILNKNPLEDISNIETTFLVLKSGKVISKEDN